MDAKADPPRRSYAFGLERAGFLGLGWPRLTILLIVLISVAAAFGLARLKVDDSLSELFRTDTEEFRRYEEIDRRFPSSEYDVLVVVEGKDLLKKPQLEAFRRAIIDLQLADGVDGLISMLSARGKPDPTGYAPPIVPGMPRRKLNPAMPSGRPRRQTPGAALVCDGGVMLCCRAARSAPARARHP